MASNAIDRYRQDRSPEAFDRLVAEHWPMVLSVCRGYLADAHEAEDATQDTFIKLIRGIDTIETNLEGWLSTTAKRTCIDRVRRRYRQRMFGIDEADVLPAEAGATNAWTAALGRLDEALGHIDAASRDLLIERFLRQTPLRVLAGSYNTSVPTMSRRCAAAIRQLAEVFDDMGMVRMDDAALAQWLMKTDSYHVGGQGDGHDLRCGAFKPDRDPLGRFSPPQHAPPPPGWNRPIRIGVMVSLTNITTIGFTGDYMDHHPPLASLLHLRHPGYELFAVIDPGSGDRGPIEYSIRDYEIHGGLMTWADRDALASLDVIVIGASHRVPPGAIESIHAAVRAGVGLYNEYHLSFDPSDGRTASDPRMLDLMLSDSEQYKHCVCRTHAMKRPAHVVREHPIIAGLGRGETLQLTACGAIFTPKPTATVLIERDDAVLPTFVHVPGMAPQRIVPLVIGQLGHGRIVYNNSGYNHKSLQHHPALSDMFVTNCINWLAEPRRGGDAAAEYETS